MDATNPNDERPPRQPYVEPLVGERRACRCLKCGSCGATFLHDAPISDFRCPDCKMVLCQSCSDAGHGENGNHAGIDPAKVNQELRALAARAEKAEREREEAREALKYIASHRGLTLLGDGSYSDGVHDGWIQLADAADAALAQRGGG